MFANAFQFLGDVFAELLAEISKEALVQEVGEMAIAVGVQMSPVQGEANIVLRIEIESRLEDVDEVNESHLTVIENAEGTRVGVRQIAGLIAS